MRSNRANKIKIKDRDSVSGKEAEGQDMRGERRWGQERGPDGDTRQSKREQKQQLKEQPGERARTPAKEWGIQGYMRLLR